MNNNNTQSLAMCIRVESLMVWVCTCMYELVSQKAAGFENNERIMGHKIS